MIRPLSSPGGRSLADVALSVARRVPTSIWLAWLVQTVFLVVLFATDGYDVARHGESLRVVLTYTTLAALFGLVGFSTRPGSRAARAAAIALFVLLVAFDFAEFETVGSFDYAFARENVAELATPLGRHIVGARVKPIEIVLLLVLPIALGAAILSRRPRWRGAPLLVRTRRARGVAALACVAALVATPLSGVTTHESLTTFALQALRYHLRAEEATAGADDAGRFPYVRELVPSDRARALAGAGRSASDGSVEGDAGADAGGGDGAAPLAAAPRPHVLLLFLESWSGIYDDRLRPDGRAFTPVFDAHRREGLSVAHFYANSIQSSRGRFATLCSLVPLVHGKEFTDLGAERFHCLPQTLADAGYATEIYSASDEPMFEQSEPFFRHLGFARVVFEDPKARGEDRAMWGAGLQDDVFYRQLFARIDADLAREPGRPLFVAAINASNHYPFDQGPAHVPLAGYPTKYARNYLASLSAQDAWLATFFEELGRRPALRDAIVVLVGDHSFPADEHGVHFNGLGAYEESFRTAFALFWPGHVTPQRIEDRTFSQLDIAPTIADLLQLRGPSHFVGRSMVAAPTAPRGVPAPLVQPYDGVRLVAVRYPFKLEVHEAADQEHLYDLSSDPDEERDRIDVPSLRDERDALRRTIARIRASDAIVHQGRVWP